MDHDHHGKKTVKNQIKIYEKMDEFNLIILNIHPQQEFHCIPVINLQMTDSISKISFQVISEALKFAESNRFADFYILTQDNQEIYADMHNSTCLKKYGINRYS
jgi:hypothetical protein